MTIVRRRLLAGVACLAVAALGARAGAGPASPGVKLLGQEAPDFTLKSTSGRNIRLSEFRGQVVLVNFWARWASQSRQQIPALGRIHETYARAGLVVLGVSVDPDGRRAAEFAAAAGIAYPVLIATDPQIGRAYAVDQVPMTILIDRDGVVRYVHTGFDNVDESAYVEQIRALLRD